MRNSQHASADNESLQADVMRFMAIIAFCLIAILALVRDAEPPPAEAERVAIASAPVVTQPIPEPQTLVTRALAVEPVVPEATHNSDVRAVSAGGAAAGGAAAAKERASARAMPQKTEGLTLQFASDGDFLRLISRGDVTVFAYREDIVWALGRDYVFRNARAPEHVYELELRTIPLLVSDAFARDHTTPNGFTWGVSLPRRIESQIQSYIQRVKQGVLLIDRYGEVRHVVTS